MKLLILGCNEIADFIVSRLIAVKDITEICIAAREKSQCDVLRNKYQGKGARIMTARVDLDNEAGTRMMLSITQPDLIVNLAPLSLSLSVMKLAIESGANYIDCALYNWESNDLLSDQFTLFSEFRDKEKMAIAGCGMSPALLSCMIRNTLSNGFLKIDSADIYEMNMYAEDKTTGSASLIENGALEVKDPMSVKLETNFDAFGNMSVCLSDSPAIRVFLKEYTDVPNVRSFVSFVPEEKPDYSKELELLGMNSEEPVEVASGVSISPKAFWQLMQDSKKTIKSLSGPCGIGVVVTGDGAISRKKSIVYTTSDNTMSLDKYGMPSKLLLDAYTLLTGINLIVSNKWQRSGVYSPTSFNADLLIEGLKDNGLGIRFKDLPVEE